VADRVIEELDEAESLRLISAGGIGRMLIYSAVTIAATLLGAAAGQSGSGRISMSPQGHSAAHRPQPLQ
jgi:hypothetical protein